MCLHCRVISLGWVQGMCSCTYIRDPKLYINCIDNVQSPPMWRIWAVWWWGDGTLMVLFEKIFSDDKRDATCSPCGYPCSCITVLCFHEQAEARYISCTSMYLFHFIQYMWCHLIHICSPTLGTTVEEGKGDEGCCYSQLYTTHFSSSRLYTVSHTVYCNSV